MRSIVFFLPSLEGGGAERTIVNIANKINRESYKAYLLIIDAPTEGKHKAEYSGSVCKDVEIINLGIPIRAIYYPRILFALVKMINRIKPDIIMGTMLRPNELLTLAALFFNRSIKLILRESANHLVTEYSWLERKYIRFMYGKIADCTVALSWGVKENMVNNFGIEPSNIRVIYNPVDIEYIEQQMSKNVPELETSAIKLVSIGRLVKEKDQKTLIKAIAIIKKYISCKLYLLGKGELEKELKELVHSLALDEEIIFMGFQSNPYAFLAQCDLFILSSEREGFGHVIVEAMAAEVPVISTACNYGPIEIIDDNFNGILSPVGNAEELAKHILDLVSDRKKMHQLKIHGKERARDFSVKKIVAQYEALFEKL